MKFWGFWVKVRSMLPILSDHLDLLVCLGVLVALFYLAFPLVIRFQQRMPKHPHYAILDLNTLEPSLAKFLTGRTEALYELGFDEPTLVQIEDQAPNVNAYLVMLVNRK